MTNNNPVSLADSAYDYIEAYKVLVKEATRGLNEMGQNLATAADTLAYDESRYAYLEDLVKRLEQTDKFYANTAEVITRATKLARIIVTNVEFVTDAIELLLCSVRLMSQSTDELKGKIDAFKKLLNNLDKNNGLYKKLLELEEKNTDAILANKEAIKKSLDTLKEIYIIYVNLLGKTVKTMQKIAEYKGKHVIVYGRKGVTESCGTVEIFEHCSDKMEGLVSHFEELQKLLNGVCIAYPFSNMDEEEKKFIPCIPDEKVVYAFPLSKKDGFFTIISNEKKKADESRSTSKAAHQKALSNRDGVQAELAGYQAALKAAEDARKVTTG